MVVPFARRALVRFCGVQVRCVADLVSVTMSVVWIVFGVASLFSPLENGDFPGSVSS